MARTGWWRLFCKLSASRPGCGMAARGNRNHEIALNFDA